MEGFLQKLKGLDAYPKVNEDFYKRTLSGGVVTVVASVVMLLLFVSETRKCVCARSSRRRADVVCCSRTLPSVAVMARCGLEFEELVLANKIKVGFRVVDGDGDLE